MKRLFAISALVAFTLAPVATFAQESSNVGFEPAVISGEVPADAGGVLDVLDPELLKVIGALGQAFTSPTGGVSWTILAPAIVFLLVWLARKKGAGLIPFLGTRLGGILLAALSSIAIAVLDLVLAGGVLSASTVLLIVFKIAYGAFGGMGLQSAQHNLRQHIAGAKSAGDEAAAAVSSTRAALNEIDPQP